MSDKLTNKQQAFVNEYLIDYNATQAAIRAGYSPNTAYSQGARLLKNVEVSAAIQEKTMGADEVLNRLSDIARGDMADFLDISSMSFQIDLNKAVTNGMTKLIRKVKMRTTTTLSKDGVETETHDMEIELYNAQDALVQLGKYHKLFVERQELTGADGAALTIHIAREERPE